MMLVGVVARTHGIKGEVVVNGTTDFADERFAVGARLWCRAAGAEPELLTVRSFRMHGERPLVAFDGVSGIDEAERFAKCELRIPSAAAKSLPEHVYYVHQLVGCDVLLTSGAPVGRVRAIDGDGAVVRLVVAGERGDMLVPFVQAFCAVDVAAGRIVISPPDGLLEVNETGSRLIRPGVA